MQRLLLILLLPAALAAGLWLYLRRAPAPGRSGQPVPLDIWFTADTSGRIEPCGCFTGQYGGLTRVSTTLRNAPRSALRLEIGNALAGTEDHHLLQFRHLLAAEAKLGYHALNLGSREASLPADTLRSLAKDSPLPLISANVLDATSREPLVQPWRVVDAGGLRVGLVGVVRAEGVRPHASVYIEEPAESLRRAVPAMKQKADVLVCMAFTDESGMAAIARDFYEFTIILGGDVRQPSQSLQRVNQSWILATTNQARALGELHTKWDPATRSFEPATGRVSLMHDLIPEDPDIAVFSRNYRREVRTADLKVDHPGESADAIPGVGPAATFAGSESCAGCHATAFASWQKSKHAYAFESLVRKESDADPSCIGCHTIGFGEPGGYRRRMKAEQFVHVGCESCHGPGSEHIKARSAAIATGEPVLYKMRPVGAGQCIQCHYGEFSRPFQYAEFWPLVQHGKEPR
jgi:Cytochrome c554 and c-prime